MTLPTSRERLFVERLVALTDPQQHDGRATLASLRRGLGKPLGTAAEMYPFVVRYGTDGEGWDADRYYLVASLFASHPENWSNAVGDERSTNFGASLRRARRESGAAETAMLALLNSDRDELPDRLRHSVGLCESATPPVPIDWARLLHDLRWWSNDRRDVQRRWAAAFWQPDSESEE